MPETTTNISQIISVSHNGTVENIQQGTLLADAIKLWGYGDKKVAAAINSTFVARTNYSDTPLNQGDKVDIVRPVGGG